MKSIIDFYLTCLNIESKLRYYNKITQLSVNTVSTKESSFQPIHE